MAKKIAKSEPLEIPVTPITKKTFWKSRTLWLAVIQCVIAVVLVVEANYPELRTAGGILVVKSILDVVLRSLTAEPVM